MQAATVDMLIQKGKFDPPVAVAVAEVIDVAIANAQLVTIPVLDARFAVSEARVDARFAAFEARIDARFVALESKMDVGFAKVDARFEAGDARTDAKLQKIKTDLIFWIIAVVVGNSYLPKIASGIAEAIRALY